MGSDEGGYDGKKLALPLRLWEISDWEFMDILSMSNQKNNRHSYRHCMSSDFKKF